MKLYARTFAFLALGVLSACTATVSQAPSDGGSTETDASTGDANANANALNPYGVAYPTKNLGWKVRAGATAGEVAPNVRLVGYAPGAANTASISLADVYDPQGKTHDLVAILLCASWNDPSNQLMAKIGELAPARVAMLAVLGEATAAGTPATLTNLTSWRSKVPATVHNLLDPSWASFTGVRVTTVPHVVLLDARTMEIVSSESGAPADPKGAFESAAAAVKARPPAF